MYNHHRKNDHRGHERDNATYRAYDDRAGDYSDDAGYQNHQSNEYTNVQLSDEYQHNQQYLDEVYTDNTDIGEQHWSDDYSGQQHDEVQYGHEHSQAQYQAQYDDERYRHEPYEHYSHQQHNAGYHHDGSHPIETRDRDYRSGVYEQEFNVDAYGIDDYPPQDYADDGYREDQLKDPEFTEYAHGQPGALYFEDFKDVGPRSRNRITESLGKVAAGIAIALFIFGFAAITMFASKPQMTPAEIVQMDGYKGPERDRTQFFNLASLRDCNTIQDCDGIVSANQATANSSTKTTFGKNTAATSDDGSPGSMTQNYLEIPAVATSVQRPVPAENSQWSVQKQWSIVRESPERSSAIIASLEANRRVTVLNEIGDWREITTTTVDGAKPVVTGFMHHSLLQPAKP